jgi:hypothetical protein
MLECIKKLLINSVVKSGKFFIDCKGKDASFKRWRVCLYDHKNHADTFLFTTELAYLLFIAKYEKLSKYTDYNQFAKENNYNLAQKQIELMEVTLC